LSSAHAEKTVIPEAFLVPISGDWGYFSKIC
jgi:hypothetical protein